MKSEGSQAGRQPPTIGSIILFMARCAELALKKNNQLERCTGPASPIFNLPEYFYV
jgi:hypothetical protein